jgi:hypothetical protein
MLKNILVVVVLVAGVWLYATGERVPLPGSTPSLPDGSPRVEAGKAGVDLEEKVLPSAGVILPVRWGDLGKQMIATGVIDGEKFEQLYSSRGGLTPEMKAMLKGENNGNIKITAENSGVILNLLWALGLGSKNEILDKGPMTDKNYGGAGNFASTGGWTLAKGDPSTGLGASAMDHYSQHQFFNLTPEQQTLVEKMSKGIYRPCCGNSTYFPDCNHGMAMLGLLELMASQGVSESDMWQTALAVNSYWFPDTYLTIATYMKNNGVDWKDVSPQEMLGADYSSGQGYAKIASQVTTSGNSHSGGSGCGVDAGAPAPQRQSSGCGVAAGQPAPVAVPQKQTGCGI